MEIDEYYKDVKIIKKTFKMKLKLTLKIFLVVLTVFGVICCSVFLSEALTVRNVGAFFIQGDRKIKLNEKKYFAITLGEFDNFKDAEKIAIASQIQGASGVIWEDGKFYVIGNIYKKLEDANSVSENLKNSNFKIGIKEITLNKKTLLFEDLDSLELYKIESAIKLLGNIYDVLYGYSIKFDKGEINKLAVSSGVGELRGEVKKHIVNLQNSTTIKNEQVQKIQNVLIEIDEMLNVAMLQCLSGDIGNYLLKKTIVSICRSEYNLVNNM